MDFVKRHPLATVLIVALLLRLPAVIWSKGYMASDDHYETIEVAYSWVQGSPWYEDGIRMVPERPAHRSARFPLYNLFLYGIMMANKAVGVNHLDSMMYSVRAAHALLSLLAVWAAFGIVRRSTGSDRWGVAAGLTVAGFYVLPFFAVRNLIEMVGGHLWLPALYMLYKYEDSPRPLVWAGVLTGLAWMVRFQIAFVALPIPFILWWQHRSLRPALWYSASVAGMIVLAFTADLFLLNGFAASTIRHISQVLTEPPPYQTPILIYVYVLLGVFIPPFSIIAIILASRREVIRQHALLWFSTVCFMLAHTLSASRQERYMLPVLPALLVLFVLALYVHRKNEGWLFRRPRLAKSLMIAFAMINVPLLTLGVTHYGHRGLVEPFAIVQQQDDAPHVLVANPGRSQLYAFAYAGGYRYLPHETIEVWEHLPRLAEPDGFGPWAEWVVVYESGNVPRQVTVDSLEKYLGPLSFHSEIEGSLIDRLLHELNPRHNPINAAWLYTTRKLVRSSP